MEIEFEKISRNQVTLQALNVSRKYINEIPNKIGIKASLIEIKINKERENIFAEYHVDIYNNIEDKPEMEDLLVKIEILYQISFPKKFKDMELEKDNLHANIDFIVYPDLRALVEKVCYDMGFLGIKIPLTFLGRDKYDKDSE